MLKILLFILLSLTTVNLTKAMNHLLAESLCRSESIGSVTGLGSVNDLVECHLNRSYSGLVFDFDHQKGVIVVQSECPQDKKMNGYFSIAKHSLPGNGFMLPRLNCL